MCVFLLVKLFDFYFLFSATVPSEVPGSDVTADEGGEEEACELILFLF